VGARRRDAMGCLRLSDKGVFRWYTDCCRTPIGNTAASPRFPAPAADRRPALVSISHLLKPKLNGFCRRLGRDQNRGVCSSRRECSRIHSIPRRAASWSCGLVYPSTTWIRSARSASVSGYCFGRARRVPFRHRVPPFRCTENWRSLIAQQPPGPAEVPVN
jgi:hypothetical protein